MVSLEAGAALASDECVSADLGSELRVSGAACFVDEADVEGSEGSCFGLTGPGLNSTLGFRVGGGAGDALGADESLV